MGWPEVVGVAATGAVTPVPRLDFLGRVNFLGTKFFASEKLSFPVVEFCEIFLGLAIIEPF
jgi:hypothetical protein